MLSDKNSQRNMAQSKVLSKCFRVSSCSKQLLKSAKFRHRCKLSYQKRGTQDIHQVGHPSPTTFFPLVAQSVVVVKLFGPLTHAIVYCRKRFGSHSGAFWKYFRLYYVSSPFLLSIMYTSFIGHSPLGQRQNSSISH